MGALLAAILYNYISVIERFHVVPWFGLGGMLLTLFFLPDTTGLDLKEQERRWQYIRAGRESDYHGIAVHPKHLSLWERLRGVGKHYNPELDYQQKIEEMRADWESVQARKVEEKAGHWDDAYDDHDDSVWSSDVSTYFEKTSRSPMIAGREKYGNGGDGGEKTI